jgi:integrase
VLQIIRSFLVAIRVFVRSRSDTALELPALRQQVAVLRRKRPRPKLNSWDRLFWTALRQRWSRWTDVLVLVKPDTVVGWRRLQDRVRVKIKAGFALRERLKPATVHQELRVLRRILNVAVRKKLLPSNPCAGVEFPVNVKGLFRPHYMGWAEQQQIEFQAPDYLRNIIGIITETGLRVYKELMPMKKDQVDLENAVVWIPDSKTANGIAEVPLTEIAVKAFRDQWALAGKSPWLFPSDENPTGHQKTLKTVWHATLRRAKVPYFRIYDLRSTYATRLSAGGVADEWVTQLLRQGDAKVFKKYSQMKLQMKREALQKLNRQANESSRSFDTEKPN